MKKIFLILILFTVASCSLNYHLKKAIKKGYKCEETSDTIRIATVDSFPVILHDSIVWEKVVTQKDTIVRYSVSKLPKTRFEIRFDKKRFADSLKTIRKMYADSLDASIKMHHVSAKQTVKVVKQENKKTANLFLIGLFTGIILTIITRYAINQALKKFA